MNTDEIDELLNKVKEIVNNGNSYHTFHFYGGNEKWRNDSVSFEVCGSSDQDEGADWVENWAISNDGKIHADGVVYNSLDEFEKKLDRMTTEEKQLLLIDLCARLPYGLKFQYIICDFCEPYVLEDVDVKREQIITEEVSRYDIEEIKPYLRPMSSMTEDEKNEYHNLYEYEEREYNQGCNYFDEWKVSIGDEVRMADIINWLNAHHFDYRGLIEMGLALEAPKDMYSKQ